ncbi:hypothetical protein [Candidatus Clostridium stratigraminis]|uniref:Uncharacterized protein n=1 Tax=Candidatus Clostridium stratigraminis TaxID=3381661 RepID=A0ABW8T5B8_9CLOT
MRAFPFPDKIMSREELLRDLLYEKIPKGDLESISDRAWETGAAAAKAIIKEHGFEISIIEIAKISGLTIERSEKDHVAGNVRYFSEYYSGRNAIILYTESVSKWAKINRLSMDEAEELILSHEYFHFLECTKLGLTSKQYMVPNIKIGKIVLGKSGIRALSEIGAHGFSRTFYELRGQAVNEKISNKQNLLCNEAVNPLQFDGEKTAEKIFSYSFKNIFSSKDKRR